MPLASFLLFILISSTLIAYYINTSRALSLLLLLIIKEGEDGIGEVLGVLNIFARFNNILFLGVEGEVKRALFINIEGLEGEVKRALFINIEGLNKEVKRVIKGLGIERDIKILATPFSNALFLYNYNNYLFISAYLFFKTLRL
jgi:hypothetical protein